MRTLLVSQIILIATLVTSSTFAFDNSSLVAEVQAIERVAPIGQVFMPERQNSSDDVFAVVFGWFPNGCYVYNRAKIEFHTQENFHRITNFALVHPGMCIMVIVFFNKHINFGKLSKGLHTFQFLSRDGTSIIKTVLVE